MLILSLSWRLAAVFFFRVRETKTKNLSLSNLIMSTVHFGRKRAHVDKLEVCVGFRNKSNCSREVPFQIKLINCNMIKAQYFCAPLLYFLFDYLSSYSEHLNSGVGCRFSCVETEMFFTEASVSFSTVCAFFFFSIWLTMR